MCGMDQWNVDLSLSRHAFHEISAQSPFTIITSRKIQFGFISSVGERHYLYYLLAGEVQYQLKHGGLISRSILSQNALHYLNAIILAL